MFLDKCLEVCKTIYCVNFNIATVVVDTEVYRLVGTSARSGPANASNSLFLSLMEVTAIYLCQPSVFIIRISNFFFIVLIF